jgi:AICAR transformylase/IMP cyclohydrolase PurH
VKAGPIPPRARWNYARQVFAHTAEYDATVRDWMNGVPAPEV